MSEQIVNEAVVHAVATHDVVTRARAEAEARRAYIDWTNGSTTIRLYPISYGSQAAYNEIMSGLFAIQSKRARLGAEMGLLEQRIRALEPETDQDRITAVLDDAEVQTAQLRERGLVIAQEEQHLHNRLLLLQTRREDLPNIDALALRPGTGPDGLFSLDDYHSLLRAILDWGQVVQDLGNGSTPPSP